MIPLRITLGPAAISAHKQAGHMTCRGRRPHMTTGDIAIGRLATEFSLLARTCRPGGASPFFVSTSNSKAVRCDHVVSAFVLCLIHGHVGAAQNAVYRVAAFPLGNARTARDAERFRLCKAQGFNCPADTLSNFNRIGEVAGHQKTKLFATKSTDNAARYRPHGRA